MTLRWVYTTIYKVMFTSKCVDKKFSSSNVCVCEWNLDDTKHDFKGIYKKLYQLKTIERYSRVGL